MDLILKAELSRNSDDDEFIWIANAVLDFQESADVQEVDLQKFKTKVLFSDLKKSKPAFVAALMRRFGLDFREARAMAQGEWVDARV